MSSGEQGQHKEDKKQKSELTVPYVGDEHGEASHPVPLGDRRHLVGSVVSL